ncbi:MAG: type IV pilus twitching motility protein PilT [Phycisphaerae bacterium]
MRELTSGNRDTRTNLPAALEQDGNRLDVAIIGRSRNGQPMDDEKATDLLALLHAAAENEASDVHLVPGYPPMFRIHGRLQPAGDTTLEPEQVKRMVEFIAPDRVRGRLHEIRNLDSSIGITHEGSQFRFRANLFLAQGNWCACLRRISQEIPSFEWLGFPESLAQQLVSWPSGLVIIAGVTGSGKSSTLAALIDLLRKQSERRILTIEEPIEFLYPPGGGGLVSQREVGRDVDSFADGLKYGLRQDPDVILVGEIRDRETARIALTAAETGHLILTTMHTRDAKGALTRLVDLFPHAAQEDVRKQIAMSLRSVVSQHLLPSTADGEKRVLALEVLHINQQVQVAIRAGKIESIESAIQTGKRDGMIMLDDDLQRLVALGKISPETARRFAKDPASIVGSGRNW